MKRLALAAALVALPLAALADVVGTYVVGTGKDQVRMTISYKDDRNVRLDVGPAAYMLLTGDKVYMVSTGEDGTQVVDLDSLSGLAKLAGKAAPAPAPGKEPKVTVTRTGRSETVAGIPGDVYEILADGQRHEVVLSKDRRAQALNKGFMAIGKRMAEGLGADMSQQVDLAVQQAARHGYGGLLRSNRDFVLQSVKEGAQPAGHYALPKGATPVQVPAMPQFDPAMMQQMQQQMQQMMKQQGR